MTAYSMTLEEDGAGPLLRIDFGETAKGDAVVRDAVAALDGIAFPGGELLRINGPASLPVAMAIAHVTGHRYGAIATYDPKIPGYIVAISHDPAYAVGDLLPVQEGVA